MSNKGVTTITLKKINKAKVYQYIYQQKVTSKLQIVLELQMGLSTVSQNLTALEQEGLIERNGYFDSTGGRKAQAIQIVPNFRISIGVGILKKMFHIAAVNLYGEAICLDTFLIPYENSDAYYQKVTAKIKEFILENQYPEDSILSVSIATQGITSPSGDEVTYGTIMNNSDMKLSDFSSRLPYPCSLAHDSKAAASLELWNHPELDNAVVFLLNRNLGGAVIANRTVNQGSSMHSGTIEHLCVNPDGPLCYCGNRGCLETYCSANALEAAAGLSIKDFFEMLHHNSSDSLSQIWEDYLKHLAFAIKNLNMIIDGSVIISGYLAPYFTDDDITYLINEVNRMTPFPMEKDRIIVGTHGQYTPAIGATLPHIQHFIDKI
ncbi:MAG: ROK family protein [Lachnospiraceae bacterium]|nr:ROK family protein [Lachnospiraceae bacterium]